MLPVSDQLHRRCMPGTSQRDDMEMLTCRPGISFVIQDVISENGQDATVDAPALEEGQWRYFRQTTFYRCYLPG